MHERIRFIRHQGKQILLVDLSHCSAREVEQLAHQVSDFVTVQPHASVLLLADFSGASFDNEAVRAMKESAVFDKPYIKRTAWIGTEHISQEVYQEIQMFSGRELPCFDTRQKALSWLTGGQ